MSEFLDLLAPLLTRGASADRQSTGPAIGAGAQLLAALGEVLKYSPALSKAAQAPAATADGRTAAGDAAEPGHAVHPASDGAPETGSTAAAAPATSRAGRPDVFVDTVQRIRNELSVQADASRQRDLDIDQALRQMSDGASAQSETVVLCEAGGLSGGRVLVANPTARTLQIDFRVRQVARGSSHDAIQLPAVSFTPSPLVLGAGEIRPVRAAIDLSAIPDATGTLPLQVDMMAEGKCLGVCWLTIRIVER